MGKRFVEIGHLVTAFMLGCILGVLSIGFWLSGEIDRINEVSKQEINKLQQELSILKSKNN